jgi:hypothetical protein
MVVAREGRGDCMGTCRTGGDIRGVSGGVVCCVGSGKSRKVAGSHCLGMADGWPGQLHLVDAVIWYELTFLGHCSCSKHCGVSSIETPSHLKWISLPVALLGNAQDRTAKSHAAACVPCTDC